MNYKKSLRPEIKSVFEKSDLVLSLGYDKVRQLAMSRIEVEPNIIFNMVDEELFKGLAEGYTAREPLRLVTIGAASFYKDHDTLLKGVRSALDLGIPLHLTIIGLKVWGGDKLAETLQLIDDLDLGPHTTMIDRLGREEVADILPEFDVFLLTSIQEGFPNSVLEALASGLFVIATRHGGTEDLITDSVGRIIPVRNYKMVGDILSKIFYGDISFDPKDIRSFVVRECGREAYTKKILSYYRLAMEQNSSKV